MFGFGAQVEQFSGTSSAFAAVFEAVLNGDVKDQVRCMGQFEGVSALTCTHTHVRHKQVYKDLEGMTGSYNWQVTYARMLILFFRLFVSIMCVRVSVCVHVRVCVYVRARQRRPLPNKLRVMIRILGL